MKDACILILVLGLSGCASYPFGKDQMCSELAAFANSAPPSQKVSISLQTSWGLSKLRPNALDWRHCDDGTSKAAKAFCQYLLADSSAENPQNNLRRVMACLRGLPLRSGNFVQYDPVNVRASAFNAYGVRKGVAISVEYAPNDKNDTMQLIITAKSYPGVHD